MLEDKPIVDTSWNLKWKTSFEDYLAELHYLDRTQKRPTQDLLYEVRLVKEALTYWNSDVATWEKHQMVIPTTRPIPQAELQEPEVQPISTD